MQFLVWGLLICSLVLRFRFPAAWPGLFFGLLLTLLGSVGKELWVWSSENNGSGLPSDIRGDPQASEAFLWAASGSILAVLMLPKRLRIRERIPGIAAADWPRYQKFSFIASLVAFVIWLLGQGPSFLRRESYAITDGIDFFVRLVGFIGPILGLTALMIGIAGTATKFVRSAQIVLGILWFLSCASVGTRVAVVFPLAMLVISLIGVYRHRSIGFVLLNLVLAYASAYAALAAFTLSLAVRGQPHGLLRLNELVKSEIIPPLLDPSNWVVAIQLMVSSVAASVPITELSVSRAPSLNLLVLNANPLPSQLLDLDASGQERLWPFAWIPLSMVGEWYGASGPLGQFLLFFGIALLAAVGVYIGNSSRNPLVVAVVLGMSGIVLAMSIQYPSRSFWRGVSLLLLITLLARFAARLKRAPRKGRGRLVSHKVHPLPDSKIQL